MKQKNMQKNTLYMFEVYIVGGPIEDEFLEKNPVVSRTIEIRGSQTLAEFHHGIFNAFDREDEHMYEFQIGGKGPNDSKAKRYGSSEGIDNSEYKAHVSEIRIDSLKLKKDDIFGYWFDFGEDWWHQINVKSIKQVNLSVEYPRVAKRIGESPPQHPDYDED